MGIVDKLEEGARDLTEKGKEQGRQAIGAKADDLKNQAARKVAGFVDDQKQKLNDRLKK